MKYSIKQLTFVVSVVLLSFINMFGQGINFQKGALDDILDKAREENKLVFIDVYTTWCGPCKQMDKHIFPLEEVGTFYNDNFINYKLDAENPEFNGPELAKKYEVEGYPTYLFIDSTGNLVSKTSGAMDKDVFIKAGRQAQGEDLLSEYQALVNRFNNGDHSEKNIKALVYSSQDVMGLIEDQKEQAKAYQLFDEILKLYMNKRPETFVNAQDFKLISSQSVYYSQKLFRGHALTEYIIDHYDDFKNVVSNEEELGTFLMYMNYFGIQNEATAGNNEKYKEYIKDITGKLKNAYDFNDESKLPAVEFLTAFGDSEYAISQKDYDTYLGKYQDILDLKKPEELGAIDYLMPARRIIDQGKGTPTKAQLEKCIKFNDIAYTKYINAYVVTDYGLLMAKLGNKDKAKAYYEEALGMFKEMGERGDVMVDRFKKEMLELGL
ncbi:thioredoxin domain-containing protein [Tamlana sp. 2201CG12-4]|uniref:thioredoxin family protein n=1 Tax=Tamlana sp. 2201CG12-4 TaxID=3112582 RepID=UPI002DBCD9D3|nr:thioredoxin domain-containing protein [Tamlana sp. 2201CG12-4]MEC3907102.1 thioredoxin domain-containing protein [Tamlana sp. 2201CG12-4]